MTNSNIHVSQAANALHSNTMAPICQDLFEKTQREWTQAHPNKPMPWSYWNSAFRKAGITGGEGLAVYDNAYPPTLTKPTFAIHDARPEEAPSDYAEVLRARQLFWKGEHGPEAHRFRSKAEWFLAANRQGISAAARREVWRDRDIMQPLTLEGNLVFNQRALLHELGHASIAVYSRIPFLGIGLPYAGGEEIRRTAGTTIYFDFNAVAETAREQGIDHFFDAVVTNLSEEPISYRLAYMQMIFGGVLWHERALQRGLLPAWLCTQQWLPELGGQTDFRKAVVLIPEVEGYGNAFDKFEFGKTVLADQEAKANDILDRYDVVKSWQRAGEMAQQYDVRLGRPTRLNEMSFSKAEVEVAVNVALLSDEAKDHHIDIYREEAVPA